MGKKMKKVICAFLTMTVICQTIPNVVSNSKIYAKSNSKSNAAIEAYMDLLTNDEKAEKLLSKSCVYLNSDFKFALIDLNKDGIQEMVVTSDNGFHLDKLAYV